VLYIGTQSTGLGKQNASTSKASKRLQMASTRALADNSI
jgi:hypothetical protein